VIDSGRGAARAEDAQGTPTQSHISPSILVNDDKRVSDLSLGLFPVDDLLGHGGHFGGNVGQESRLGALVFVPLLPCSERVDELSIQVAGLSVKGYQGVQ